MSLAASPLRQPSEPLPVCPVCGFNSRYTDGDGPCSVKCALQSATDHYTEYQVPLIQALRLAREEAEERGLPQEPDVCDIRENGYRYVLVQERKVSRYWKVDRDLISSGLNVEYFWDSRDPKSRRRIYRFAPSLLLRLPEVMQDYKVRNLNRQEMYFVGGPSPYWHFLPAK